MSIRVRLVLALLVVALVPLVFFAVGVRRELDTRLAAGERTADEGAVRSLRRKLGDDGRRVGDQLAGIGRALADDPRVVLALQGNEAARRWLIDFAGQAMEPAGLDVLAVVDSDGTLLSVGHYRNRYGQHAELPQPTAEGPALLAARTPGGTVQSLAGMRTVTVGARSLRVIGGVALDSTFLAGAVADSLLHLVLVLPGQGAAVPDAVDTVRLPYWSLDSMAAQPDSAALVIQRRGSNLAALRRSVAQRLAAALAVAGLIALVLAVALASGMSRPLRDLTVRAESVDLSHLGGDFSSGRTDEVGRLSNALDAMLARLRASTGQLRDAERRAATGDLARQVNHDVKNGLTPIRHVLRHLSQVARDQPGQLAAVYREREATLDASVSHLDALARSYAGLAPGSGSGRVHVPDLLREVLRDLGDPRVRLVGTIPDGGVTVQADPVRLRRITHNLVSNALESLEAPDATVEVMIDDGADGMVGFAVVDHGRGMTAAELNRAFNDFYTTKAGGTGLGLSSVRRLVLELGGRLKASSVPGEGSRFEVWLPRAVAQEPSA